jgi:hypothetical protein
MNKQDIIATVDFIPDKLECRHTTSKQFKIDLIEYFHESAQQLTLLEVGSALGHSTFILSQLFKKVIAVDNVKFNHDQSKALNADRDNIEYILMNVYGGKWNFENVDVCFIDCDHSYNGVKADIENAINIGAKTLIFDDYGLCPQVKQALDEYIDDGTLKIEKRIGLSEGAQFPNTHHKTLKDSEGLICIVKGK